MAVFDKDIILIEGDYTNDPDDSGGETKYGISKNSYPHEDIKNLTIERAIEIYTRDFWNPNNLSSIQDQTTANLVFRFIVNAGKDTAIRTLQECLNTFVPIIPSVNIDGVLGKRTLQAINNIRTIRLHDTFRVATCRYYLNLVKRKPSQVKYFKGWINRALM
jgi:lysozyme family protein